MSDSSWTVGVAIAATAYVLARGATGETAKRDGSGYLLRGGGRVHRFIIHYVGLGIFVFAAYRLGSGQDGLLPLILMPLYPLGLLFLPRSIRFDKQGISQRTMTGRRRYYSWKEIGRVISDQGFDRVLLYDKEGSVVLQHTRYHTGRRELLQALGKLKFHVAVSGAHVS